MDVANIEVIYGCILPEKKLRFQKDFHSFTAEVYGRKTALTLYLWDHLWALSLISI